MIHGICMQDHTCLAICTEELINDSVLIDFNRDSNDNWWLQK